MRGNRLRSRIASIVAILFAASLLTMSIGSVSRAIADDTFETWPRKETEPGVETTPAIEGAAQAGEAAGKKTATGLSSGTIGWIAAGAAAIIGIGIAAGGGGGGGGSSSTSNH